MTRPDNMDTDVVRSPASQGRAATPVEPSPAVSGKAGIPNAAHTPGPWSVLPLGGKYYGTHIAIGRNGGQIVVWTSDEGDTRPSVREIATGWEEDCGFDHVETAECYANARLIAAAPELYEDLAVLVQAFGQSSGHSLWRRAKATLAKARGEVA